MNTAIAGSERKNSIIVEIKARSSSKPGCSICGKASPGCDTLPERLSGVVPMWGLRVFFRYAMRRQLSSVCLFHQLGELPGPESAHKILVKRLKNLPVAGIFERKRNMSYVKYR